MNKKNIRTEGPFVAHWNNRQCFSCGKKVGENEYRHTWSEELYNKTGGKEGRTYYCVPCGERISAKEIEEENKERERYNEEKEQNALKVVADCLATVNSLKQKLTSGNVAGTTDDYRTIKNVEKRIKNLGSFKNQDIENLKETCRELTNTYISPKDRKIGNNKGKTVIHPICCLPKNFKLEEEETEPYYYCDYCWETESPSFLKSLKSYHIDKLNKAMLDNGVSATELNSSNYHGMLTIPDFILTQEGIINAYQKAKQDLQVFLERKGIKIDVDKSNQIKSNQIKSNQIKSNQIKSNQIKSSNFPI